MKKDKLYQPHINNLIALSYMLDQYEDFMTSLKELLSTKNSTEIVIQIERLIKKEKVPFNIGKIRKFYNDNKEVIEIINKYSSLGYFINDNFTWKGEAIENEGTDFFYHYMMEHIDEIEKIRELLAKLEKIGFQKLTFDPNANFTKQEYTIERNFSANFRIDFFDNIEVIPNYEYDKVLYKTTDSSYKITLGIADDEFSDYDRNITVKDLLFDLRRLPDSLTKEEIFNSITDVKDKKSELCDKLRDSVDMGICITDLREQFIQTNYILGGIETEEQARIKEILADIDLKISELEKISSTFDEKTSKESEELSIPLLDDAKKAYVKRRNYYPPDID